MITVKNTKFTLPYKGDELLPATTIVFSGKNTKKCYIPSSNPSNESYKANGALELIMTLPTTRSYLHKLSLINSTVGMVWLFDNQEEMEAYQKAAGVSFKDPNGGPDYPKVAQAHFIFEYTAGKFTKPFKTINLSEKIPNLTINFTPKNVFARFGYGHLETKNFLAYGTNDTLIPHGSNIFVILLVVLLAITGAFMYYKHDQSTKTLSSYQ